MTAIGLVGVKGAPGVTTSALLLAAVWPRPALLLEADPAGGDLRWWHCGADGLPLRPDTGVVSLLAADRSRPAAAALIEHAQLIPGGLPVLVGVSSPSQHQALAPSWPALAALLSDRTQTPAEQPDGAGPPGGVVDVVVDVGRLGNDAGTGLLLAAVPLVLLVCRPAVASVAHARHALSALRRRPPAAVPFSRELPVTTPMLGVIVIGTASDRQQVRTAMSSTGPELRCGSGGQELFFGHLADDPAAAAGLAGEWTRRLDRSPLVASGRRLASELHQLLNRANPIPAEQSPAGRSPAEPVPADGDPPVASQPLHMLGAPGPVGGAKDGVLR